jgi:hypothetical protein
VYCCASFNNFEILPLEKAYCCSAPTGRKFGRITQKMTNKKELPDKTAAELRARHFEMAFK